MEFEDKKQILKKLMQDALTEEERMALQASRRVEQKMFCQWDTAPDAVNADRPDETSIWHTICKHSWERTKANRIEFYKIYSWVASIILLIGIAGSAYFLLSERNNAPVYIVSAGIQNMEAVSLPDGTKVQLGPGSRLTYPEKFTGRTREVTLNGQAFFDVSKNPHKAFIVHTSDMDVQALGTAFELFSYDVENKSEAILLNGKIKVGVVDEKTGERTEYLVSPDQKLVLDKQSGIVTKYKVDADTYTSWRKQRFLSFENEKLSMIIPRLEQWYGRKIMCQKDLAQKYRFTFKVRDESLDRILFMIGESSPLKHAKINNENYILSSK